MLFLSRYLKGNFINCKRFNYFVTIANTHSVINRNHGEKNQEKFNFVKKSNLAKISIGVCTATLGFYLLKDYITQIAPSVDAKTISRRDQFNFIADVVEIAAKSLVFIEIQDKGRVDYFSGQPSTVSNGSGFVVDSNGLILTNAHVVINKPRSNVIVKISDGRVFVGVVEAVDPTSDLATVRIQADNLPAMKMGQSSSLRAGEFVIALGSPLSLSNTVTAGVVSSTQRASEELGIRGNNINYIQTDAAITFGNSGGPLVNLDGEVIGINSMKVSPGISFAIPIDYAKEFLKLAKEKVKGRSALQQPKGRRYMGITMLSLTREIIEELKQRGSTIPSSINSGILVWKVIAGSPSHSSGLQAADIILNINGQDVKQTKDIYAILESNTKSLEMIVLRNGAVIRVVVTPENPE